MVDGSVTKPLGFVLIVTAHMVFNGQGQEEVKGILGNNITLHFTFNVTITEKSQFGVYIKKEKKISDNVYCRGCFDIYPQNSSVFYHIINLSLNDSEVYWVILVGAPPTSSNTVRLTVQEDNRSTIAPLKLSQDSGTSNLFSLHIIIVLVVVPVVLLAVLLPLIICYLVKTKDNEQQPLQTSNPTLKETVEASSSVPALPVVYSVLDFPKRTPAVVKINPSDTDYAVVSYVSEKRQM